MVEEDGVRTTDTQVRRLMEEMQKHGSVGRAALRAGMDRKTARKYVRAGQLPSELRAGHTWRTREDPFAQDWPVVVAMLEEVPELEAVTVFEHLREADRLFLRNFFACKRLAL